MPTLNSAAFLEPALLSLQQQHAVDVRVLVADSGSTDGTLDICAARGIETFFVPRGNMYRAVNEALRRLDEPWLTYLNSDDLLYVDTYQRLLATAAETDADVVYGSTDYIDRNGRFRYWLRSAPPGLLEGLFDYPKFGFVAHCAVFRREVFERVGGFSEHFRLIADMDFYARALRCGFRFALDRGAPVGAFRLSTNQLSRREDGLIRQENAAFVAGRGPSSRFSARLAVLRWKLSNAPQYVVRRLRSGHWRGFWG